MERLARPREKCPQKCNEYDTTTLEKDTTTPEDDTTIAEKGPMKSEENTTNAKRDTSKAKKYTKEKRPHTNENKAKDTTGILKLKENNLKLNYDEKTGISESLLSNVRQSHNFFLNAYSNDLPKRWKSVHVLGTEKKSEIGKTAQLRTFNMDSTGIKPTGKKTFENKFFKTKNQGKTTKKLRLLREEHADNAGHVHKHRSHVNKSTSHVHKGSHHVDNARSVPRVITMPDLGTPRTILRYTDKRYGQNKTVAIDMGSEAKLRKKPEVVIN